MPSGVPFLASLAKGLKVEFGDNLSDALILLPTRRAVRRLTEIFIQEAKLAGLDVVQLPRLNTLADIDPNEPPFEPIDVAGLVPQSIDPVQRRFEMARVIEQFYLRSTDLPLDAAAALSLADPLLSILDDAASEEIRISKLAKLDEIQSFAAQHFQYQAELYKIVQTHWPARLKELGAIEPKARQVRVLDTLTQQWEEKPPQYPIIIAGSTGTLKATARLMRCVSTLPKGMVILPGLNETTDSVWEHINDQHPLFALRNLLATLGLGREAIKQWPHVHDVSSSHTCNLAARRRILAESLVPVDNTSDWLTRIDTLRQNSMDEDPFIEAMQGLSVIEAPNDEHEALSIALIMREALETADKTVALVTPDQSLARRVKARLRRWEVDVDLSQGLPLEETAIGSFLTAIVDLLQDRSSPVALSILCNHNLMCLGRPKGHVKREWQRLECLVFRGVRPAEEQITQFDRTNLMSQIQKAMHPLTLLGEKNSAEKWATSLWQVALVLSEKESGESLVWQSEGGREAHHVLQSIIDYGHNLPDITPKGLSRLLAVLMREKVVRPPYGMHPRLAILGPLEARMIDANVVILGGLNEGVWPATPKIEPFLSRKMREAVELSLPEKRFGLSAHDFAELAANPQVFLTRSERSGGSPMVASRWLWRLKTLLEGALGPEEAHKALAGENKYLQLSDRIDQVTAEDIKEAQIEEPRPSPPVEDRWAFHKGRSVSITQVKTWIRDPYSIFARHALGLKLLDPLDAPLGAGDFGTAIHNGLENFLLSYQVDWPAKTGNDVTRFLSQAFKDTGYSSVYIAKERARFQSIATDFLEWLKTRQAEGFDVHAIESEAKHKIDTLNFTLTGKADLIEYRPDGYGVIDYKTGMPASVYMVKAGFDPQLPLTAWLIEQGAFEGVKKGQTVQLGYVRIKGSNDDFRHTHLTCPEEKKGLSAEDYAKEAIETLKSLIITYDKPDTVYYSQPRIQYTHDYGEFDDLARRDEWASLGRDFKS